MRMAEKLLDLPPLFALAARIKNKQTGEYRWATPECDLVLEGFPRSANTFLYRTLRAALGEEQKIAHHVHRSQQVAMAARYGVPAFVLYRTPVAAIASLLVRFDGKIPVEQCLSDYIAFAETTLSLSRNELVHVLTFDEVILEPDAVANDILAAIGSSENVTPEMVKKATADDRTNHIQSSLPNAEKDRQKASHVEKIMSLPNFEQALALYEQAKATKWRL